MFKGIIIVMM